LTVTADSSVAASPKSTPRPRDDLAIYVEENDALPFISIAVAIRSGASSDPVGKEGLTRVLVRMLRRGCRGLKSHEIE
jgi:predicted Zn-dependent peptidase